jgi:hypothetical protein
VFQRFLPTDDTDITDKTQIFFLSLLIRNICVVSVPFFLPPEKNFEFCYNAGMLWNGKSLFREGQDYKS